MGGCRVVVMGGCGMLMGRDGRGPWLCCMVVVSWSLWCLLPLAFVGGCLSLLVIVVGSCCHSSSFPCGHCGSCVSLVVVRERKAMSRMITKQGLFVMCHK